MRSTPMMDIMFDQVRWREIDQWSIQSDVFKVLFLFCREPCA